MRTSLPPIAVVLFAVAALLLGGYGLTQSKTDAEVVLTRHFQTIAASGVDAALADYGTQFLQETTKADRVTMTAAKSLQPTRDGASGAFVE